MRAAVSGCIGAFLLDAVSRAGKSLSVDLTTPRVANSTLGAKRPPPLLHQSRPQPASDPKPRRIDLRLPHLQIVGPTRCERGAAATVRSMRIATWNVNSIRQRVPR